MPGQGRHDAGHTRVRARTAAGGAGRICGCSRHRCASSWPRSSCCSSRSPSSGGCRPRSACSRTSRTSSCWRPSWASAIGALLGRTKRSLFLWYPALLLGVVAAVYFLRLEVRINAPGSIYFTSGTSDPVTAVETTLLLPVLFVGVAALFAALAQRMAAEMTALPPLRAYTINLAGSLAGVGAFALVSWLEAPPSVWFLVAFAAAVPLLRNRRWTAGALAAVLCLVDLRRSRLRHAARDDLVALLQDHGEAARPGDGRRGEQHLAPVDGAGRLEGVLLPVAVHGVRRHLQGRPDPRRRIGHRRGGRAQARRRAASTPSKSTRPSSGSAARCTRTGRTRTRASTRWPTMPGTS